MKHGLNGYLRHKCRCDVCRDANTESQRRYRAAHPERAAAAARARRERYRERERELKKVYNTANKDRIREVQRQWRDANLDLVAERTRRWRKRNPNRSAEYYLATKDSPSFKAKTARKAARDAWVAERASRGGTPWTAAEDAVALSGMSVREAALTLGRTVESVTTRRYNLRKQQGETA